MKLTAPPLADYYEIERRVAVEVMGLPLIEFNDRTKCPYCGVVGRAGINRIYCCNCAEWYMHPYRNYRDSMNDAMEVIEKMRAAGWDVAINAPPGSEWMVTFVDLETARMGDALDNSLPAAICVAALNAVVDNSTVEGR